MAAAPCGRGLHSVPAMLESEKQDGAVGFCVRDMLREESEEILQFNMFFNLVMNSPISGVT